MIYSASYIHYIRYMCEKFALLLLLTNPCDVFDLRVRELFSPHIAMILATFEVFLAENLIV